MRIGPCSLPLPAQVQIGKNAKVNQLIDLWTS